MESKAQRKKAWRRKRRMRQTRLLIMLVIIVTTVYYRELIWEQLQGLQTVKEKKVEHRDIIGFEDGYEFGDDQILIKDEKIYVLKNIEIVVIEKTGIESKVIPLSGFYDRILEAGDGILVFSSESGSFQRLTAEGEVIDEITGQSDIKSVTYLSDGQYLAVYEGDKSVGILDSAGSVTVTYDAPQGHIIKVVANDTNIVLITMSSEGTEVSSYIYNFNLSGEIVAVTQLPGKIVYDVDIEADRVVCVADKGMLAVDFNANIIWEHKLEGITRVDMGKGQILASISKADDESLSVDKSNTLMIKSYQSDEVLRKGISSDICGVIQGPSDRYLIHDKDEVFVLNHLGEEIYRKEMALEIEAAYWLTEDILLVLSQQKLNLLNMKKN